MGNKTEHMMEMLTVLFPDITTAERMFAVALLKDVEAMRARELWRMRMEALPPQRMN